MTYDSTAPATVKRLKPGKNRDEASPYELQGIIALNADRNRSYPEIDKNPPAGRSQMVLDAVAACPTMSRFELCRRTTRLTRIIHNSSKDRVPVTITKALKWIAAQPAAKKVAPQAERKTAQAEPVQRDLTFAAGGPIE